jgi:signal transduction histidine kinase
MKLRIRHKMAAMVLLTVVPMFLYTIWDFGRTIFTEKDRIARQNLQQARSVAERYTATLQTAIDSLAPLARHPEVMALNTAAVDPLFASLFPNYPDLLNFILANMAGDNVGTAVPSPTIHTKVINYRDRNWFTDTLSGRPGISDLYTSKLFKVPAVMVAIPVRDKAERQVGVLGFALNLARLSSQLSTAGMPEGSIITVLDRQQDILSCSQNARHIGSRFTNEDAITRALAAREGTVRSTGMDGIERLISFTTMERSGWKVLVGVPTDEAFFLALRSAGGHMVFLLMVCLTGIPLSYLMARKMSNNIEQMVDGLAEIERGNLDYRLTLSGCDELTDLAESFNRMTAARLRAETEVQNLNSSLEKQVQTRTQELQTANRELESFCYSVSHDLRAPVRHMKGFAQILLEDFAAGMEPQAAGYLEKIRTSCDRMDDLITDLLKLSRYSRADLNMEELDLEDLARATEAELRDQDPERRVDVVIQKGLTVRGDRPLITAVIENLMGNAWKYSSHTDQARIEVGMVPEQGERRFYVRDNGAGFDMEYADKLFTPFHRLHNAKEFEGTGIGLASVQRIISRHGGRIWAEAAPGAGATFFFTLP